MSNAGTPRKPSLNKELDVAKKVTVYQNGNKHFAGCDAYLNQKYFPSPNIFMDHLTNLIVKKGGRQDKGCVRKLYTKSGKRIHGLAQINDGGEIVAAGNEDFQKYSYQSISPYKTPRKGQRQSRNNNFVPGRNNRYSDVKSRFNDTGEPSIRIYVHKNAQPLDKSLLVVLQQKRLDHMHYIMEDITREFFHDSKYPVDYICNLNGDMITKATDFVPEEFYVAVPPHQMFKQCDYSCRRYDPPNFIINPYYGTGLTRIPYLWQDPHSSRPTTWTSKHNPIPPISKPSPNQSVASHPEANLRRRKIRAQEDVHQKAVKHKRTPEKSVRQFEFDQDSSKIFRAKNQNKATKGAKEVKETKDTKTDLPLDQVKAEEVEEDINGYDQDERRSPRGHPYTKEKSNRELNPYKVLDPIKKDQRSSTPVDDDRDDNDRHDDGKRRKEEEEAATKIQASFRGHQTRQQLAQQKTEDTSQTKQTNQTNQTNKTKQTNQREDTQDSLTRQAENEAAAKIQAGFRGYQTRQELKAKGHKVRPPLASQGDTGETSKVTKEQQDEAATKIQASFRGYQARKDIKNMQDEKKKNEAATLIQANFKGYKVRKELKEKKSTEEVKPKTGSKQKPDNDTMSEDEAATKIQASFRGYQSRQKLKEQGEGKTQGNGDSETVISTPPHSSEAPGTKRLA